MEEAPLPTKITPKEEIFESLEINQDKSNYKLNIKIIDQDITLNLIDQKELITQYEKKLTLNELKQMHRVFLPLNSCQEFVDFLKALTENNKLLIKGISENKIYIELNVEYLFKKNTIIIDLFQKKFNFKLIAQDLYMKFSSLIENFKSLELNYKNILQENKNIKEENNNIKIEIEKLKEENKNQKEKIIELEKDIKEIKMSKINKEELKIDENKDITVFQSLENLLAMIISQGDLVHDNFEKLEKIVERLSLNNISPNKLVDNFFSDAFKYSPNKTETDKNYQIKLAKLQQTVDKAIVEIENELKQKNKNSIEQKAKDESLL